MSEFNHGAAPATRTAYAARMNEWLRNATLPALRYILESAGRDPEVISFALGLPAPECLPAEKYAEACASVLAQGPSALQLAPPFAPLKTHIAALMKLRGVECREEQILLTTGAQQAMDLMARLLVPPRGRVAVEETTFHGILQAVSPHHAEVVAVRTHAQTGIDVEHLESLLRRGVRPAFLYVIPDGHNPTGVCMPAENRRLLLSLARQYGLPILEDDAYGLLSYSGSAEPLLRSLDGELVFSIGSFSKILGPALRLGWIVAPERYRTALSILRDLAEIDAISFTQRAVSAFFDSGAFPAHLAHVRAAYQRRRNAMVLGLEQLRDGNAHWTLPMAGFFLWVRLEKTVDTAALYQAAVNEAKVAFAPGSAFSANRAAHGRNCLRLSFSHAPVDRFEEGLGRLQRLLERSQ